MIIYGYHGTTETAAHKILKEGFQTSKNSWEWLGHGIYFWQDAPKRAAYWAEDWHAKKGYTGKTAVLAAQIDMSGFIDLLDAPDMELMSGIAKEFQAQMTQSGTVIVNNPPKNRLDCSIFNFATTLLNQCGTEVKGFRAVCIEGLPIAENSSIYNKSHVQLVVKDKAAFRKVWIYE